MAEATTHKPTAVLRAVVDQVIAESRWWNKRSDDGQLDWFTQADIMQQYGLADGWDQLLRNELSKRWHDGQLVVRRDEGGIQRNGRFYQYAVKVEGN